MRPERNDQVFHVESTSKQVTDVFPVASVNGDVVMTLDEFDARCRRKGPLPNVCRHLRVAHENPHNHIPPGHSMSSQVMTPLTKPARRNFHADDAGSIPVVRSNRTLPSVRC